MSLKIDPGFQAAELLPVPNIFFTFLKKANPAYAVVYLYSFYECAKGKEALTKKEIADALNMLEGDVVRAFEYWEKMGLLALSGEEITFLCGVGDYQSSMDGIEEETEQKKREAPGYSPAEISVYVEKSATVRDLFASAQSHLGRLLTAKDMETLFGMYDFLGLPMEVIEILLAYCTKNDHRNIHYIESVAVDWAESGVNTPQKAIERINLYSNGYMRIMKAFGQGSRAPSKSELDFMKKWIQKDKIPIPLLEAACDKTVMATGKPSFSYADRIIARWKKAGVQTVEDVKRLDEEFQTAKKAKAAEQEAAVVKKAYPEKKNRFVNYEQREWDFEELERLEMERNRRQAGGE